MTLEEYSRRYDQVYQEADTAIRKYNPCNFQKGICSPRGRKGGCCGDCNYLGPNGCTTKCLSCKLHLCKEVWDKYPELIRVLKLIRRLVDDIKVEGVSPFRPFYQSKDDHFIALLHVLNSSLEEE